MSLIANANAAVRDSHVDAWLVYDYRGTNPVFSQLLGQRFFLTRRAFMLLRGHSSPKLLISRVDETDAISSLADFDVEYYSSWEQLQKWLARHLSSLATVAMEYSPNGELPTMSWVDGGTLDIVRALNVEVISSAELFQSSAAAWSTSSHDAHIRAMKEVVAIKDGAFAEVKRLLDAGSTCTEFLIQQWIQNEFDRRGLITDEPPIVAVNANSGNPHYEPTSMAHAQIEEGDWLLIDLWAKERGHDAVFADITWVGQVGSEVSERHRTVFNVVAAARDAVVEHLRANGSTPGFHLDRVARGLISDAGFGDYFVHRTGHSLSPGDSVHGLGGNLDDLETHDTRLVEAGIGFTIEPGIYLPEFGVRLEINVVMTEKGPLVTSPVQREPVMVPIATR